ncbi:glycine zipper 2TM domain-containing protein [Noviherbaspirillum pedocola]|uniref:Glycine zipper 2TM domain-containing protein n=1 Tax=Noviherbaspirillum pedocola TaxID=2801341 RepID=A0A934W7C9_9BURK|nr:glycine zipper 2TM domain-containing protein [Noviherbaspirillum pedocola]MBK4737277.1 glycine zipper 2TM domain-containing protein [Noviherbaspirillum pedocola]
MEINQPAHRIHPLVAGAAASVMLVSLVGVAAITGLVPSSHGTVPGNAPIATQQAGVVNVPTQQYGVMPAQTQQQQSVPVVVREVVEHKTVVHDQYVQHATAPRHTHAAQYAQYDSTPRYVPAPVYQRSAPAASNSPVGIGVGAVVGGLLGSQVGGGNGKTLATIAGAVGGGYVGNEVVKRNF